MTGHQFTRFLDDPGLAGSQDTAIVEDLVKRYPYCQSGQLLLATIFFSENHPDYPDQLKKAAAYAGERRILKELIVQAKQNRLSPVIPATAAMEPDIRSTEHGPLLPEQESFIHDQETWYPVMPYEPPTYERMTQEELLAIVKKRLAEINAEKKREQADSEILHPESADAHAESHGRPPASGNPLNDLPASKSALVEKFIRDEPRISKPKAAFFNATDSAIRSNFDEEEIVSETLAQLYARQGNIQKAKHIYEKLSLINQEKSRYFAAQIEKLNS